MATQAVVSPCGLLCTVQIFGNVKKAEVTGQLIAVRFDSVK